MITGLDESYNLVVDCNTIGLNEAEAEIYLKANKVDISRSQYYKLLARCRKAKKNAVWTIAKYLPEHHITQIRSLRMVRKHLLTKFLGETNGIVLGQLAKTIIEIERAISEYNGWTQRISEETLKKYAGTEEETPIHALI